MRPKPAKTFTEKVSKTEFPGELIGEKWTSGELSKNENDAFDAFMKANARVPLGAKSVTVSKQGDGSVNLIISSGGGVRLRMFSIQDRRARNNDKLQAMNDFKQKLSDELVDEFEDLDVYDDAQNMYIEGYREKYEALENAGLIGVVDEEDQVLGGFFVVDEAKMGGGAVTYARKAAKTTIRLLLAMLSCTVGKANVDSGEANVEGVMNKIKERYGGVKGMSGDIPGNLGRAMQIVADAVAVTNFTEETLFDHTDTIEGAIVALGLGEGGNVDDKKALAYLRAFNAITSFFMTARDDDEEGGLDMLTTAFDIVLQFQAVRRMVQLEALKKSTGKDNIDSTGHLVEIANAKAKNELIGSGSAYVGGGGKCGGGGRGLSKMFLERMFNTYVNV